MAQKVQVVLTCDLHETDEVPAAATVSFGVEGTGYLFELCQQHLDEYRRTVGEWTRVARKAEPTRRRAGPTPNSRPAAEHVHAVGTHGPSDVRAWAREHGFEVSDRGRIPAEVRQAYEAAIG